DLGGLEVGDEVRLGGFKVGVVKAIQVRDDVKEVASKSAPTTAPAKTDKTRLLVTFTVPTRYELHEDAVVGVQSTITGTACLNISDIGTGKVAGDEVALVGQPSALNSLLGSLGGVGPELKPMIADARLAVADVRAKTVPELNQ